MENTSSKVEPSGNNTNAINKGKAGLTPRELIYYHMNNPDEPISEEDMENLVLITTNSTMVINAPATAAGKEQIKDNTVIF